MNWRLEWTQAALGDLQHLDVQHRERIRDCFRAYAATGQGNVKRIGNRLRLRCGDYRGFFHADANQHVIFVQRIRHRSKAYRAD